jgi:hypothetical protein
MMVYMDSRVATVLKFLLCKTLCCILLSFALAQDSKLASEQVFIQLNQYYLADSYPLAPFISSQGRTMVPLKPLAVFLDAEVVLNRRAKTADFVWTTIKLHFISDSYEAFINDQAITLDSPAYWDEQGDDFIVPLRVVLEALFIPFEWHHEHRLLRVTDARLLQAPDITSSFETVMLGEFTDVAAIPQHIQVSKVNTDQGENSLVLTAQFSIPADVMSQERLSLYTFGTLTGQGGVSMYGLDLPTTQPILENPCTIRDKIINCVINYGPLLHEQAFLYLLARVGYKNISQ